MSAKPGVGAPMFYQLSHRVSTPKKGKKQPIVRLFVDDVSASMACFKSLFFREILPKSNGNKQRYILSQDTKNKAFVIANQGRARLQNANRINQYSI
jgi:hypothetical protein